MGYIIGEANVTRFSYLEYQAIMVCLAATICVGLVIIEVTMNRFQVLPLLFPGMFTIRERKFYFFDCLVDNGPVANRLRSHAKMLMRMTLCVVLSYLWQHCVMDTGQQVGTDFPTAECGEQKDCFASELHFMTLLKRQYEPVDCKGPHDDFPSRMVVSCIRFVQPSASKWLMHLAIAHSITQLNLKAFELLTWTSGNSPRMRRLLGFSIFISFAVCLGLFFSGLLSEFASSWLSFVTTLSVPMFFHTTYQSAKVLEQLWKEEAARVQQSIESHLNSAFADFGLPADTDAELSMAGVDGRVRSGISMSNRALSLLKFSGRSGEQLNWSSTFGQRLKQTGLNMLPATWTVGSGTEEPACTPNAEAAESQPQNVPPVSPLDDPLDREAQGDVPVPQEAHVPPTHPVALPTGTRASSSGRGPRAERRLNFAPPVMLTADEREVRTRNVREEISHI